MLKRTLFSLAVLAYGLMVVLFLVAGFGSVSVFAPWTVLLFVVGTLAAVVGNLLHDDMESGHPCH